MMPMQNAYLWQKKQSQTSCYDGSSVSVVVTNVYNRPVTRGAQGGEAPCEIFLPPWKNVLDIVQNYWT